MKKLILLFFWALTFIALTAAPAIAGPDLFTGDSAIYGGDIAVKPNVLFVIDNSAGMLQQGTSSAYNPATTYTGPYSPNAIYVREAATGGTINYNSYISSTDFVSCATAKTELTEHGAYYGPLKKSNGSCDASQSGNYYLGNFLNYLASPPPTWQPSTAYNQGDEVHPTGVSSVAYVCKTAGTSSGTEPTWATNGDITDNTVVWVVRPSTIIELVDTVITQFKGVSRERANFGIMVFGNNEHGGQILLPIRDMSANSTNGPTNSDAFDSAIQGINTTTLLPGNNQPINEALWDAGLYYRGQNSSTLKISSDRVAYPSPIQYTCQRNYVIVLTTGNSPDTVHTRSVLTDLNENGTAGDAVDASIYNLHTDKDNAYNLVDEIVATTVIQLMSPRVPILEESATKGQYKEDAEKGQTGYYWVKDAVGLSEALGDILGNIVKEGNTSFVAPVVPVSPENRTYSGSRVFMGFFYPKTQQR
jgi:type IV pilus assembly protein PilY1